MWAKVASFFAGDAITGTVNAIGKGASNILDRFVPKKMSEAEKFKAVKDQMSFEVETYKLEVSDVNTARELWMTELRTQPQPWIVKLINGLYRPICGYVALFYLTDKFWSQILEQVFEKFTWTLIIRDPITDGMMTLIIGFFFGMRQRSKEKRLTTVS